jgi:hypothetical protein
LFRDAVEQLRVLLLAWQAAVLQPAVVRCSRNIKHEAQHADLVIDSLVMNKPALYFVSLAKKADRGRESCFQPPPAQIRAGAIYALGSHLGCLTAKRASGQGCETCGIGSHCLASRVIFSQVTLSRWLRRRSVRRHASVT